MPLLICLADSRTWENPPEIVRLTVSCLRQFAVAATSHSLANALEQGLLRGCISDLTVFPARDAGPVIGGLICRGVFQKWTLWRPATVAGSVLQQLPDLGEGLLPARLPITANDPIGLPVALQPLPGGGKEGQALRQLWLAALTIIAPVDILRR